MAYPNRDGGRRSSGPKSYGDREMHKVICADCGQETTVPFKPETDAEGKPTRPVYCRDCYAKHKKF